MALALIGGALAVGGSGYFVYKGAKKNKQLSAKKNKVTIPGYFQDASLSVADAYQISYAENQNIHARKTGIYGIPKTIVKGTDQNGHLNAWGKSSTLGLWQP